VEHLNAGVGDGRLVVDETEDEDVLKGRVRAGGGLLMSEGSHPPPRLVIMRHKLLRQACMSTNS